LVLAGADGLPLAGNRDVFVAARPTAIVARLGNRAGYLIRVNSPVGRGLGEIPRLAIGMSGVGAAFVAPGEALIDAVAVRRIGNDKNASIGPDRRSREQKNTGQNC
jgi:hypothetical protein